MDNKVAATLLALLLVGASLAVFTISSNNTDADENERTEITEPKSENNQPENTNTEPVLLIENQYLEWSGFNHTLQGYVVDEGTSTVKATMLNLDFSIPVSYTHLTLPTSR